MKKVFLVLCALLLSAGIAVCASAQLLVDDADLLTTDEEAVLVEVLEETSDALGMDVVVVTVESLKGSTPRNYADDYYDYNGYNQDGILLLVAMSERQWYISTSGAAIDRISNAEVDRIGDAVVPYLSSEAYLDGFLKYCEQVSHYAQYGGTVENASNPLIGWLVCIIIGVVAGFVTVLIMKAQLKSVRNQNTAASYVVHGSFGLTNSHDLFMFRNVTRTARPQNNGTHIGSSGRSHGGGGGRF